MQQNQKIPEIDALRWDLANVLHELRECLKFHSFGGKDGVYKSLFEEKIISLREKRDELMKRIEKLK